MADILPPAPINEPPKSYQWVEWYKNLREFINRTANNIAWAVIDKTGANITDIPNRAHNNLQGHQGGTTNEFYHLTQAQHTNVSTYTLEFSSSTADLTTGDLAAGKVRLHKNTTSGDLKLVANDGGTIKSVLLV